jgi:hypothetical protein
VNRRTVFILGIGVGIFVTLWLGGVEVMAASGTSHNWGIAGLLLIALAPVVSGVVAGILDRGGIAGVRIALPSILGAMWGLSSAIAAFRGTDHADAQFVDPHSAVDLVRAGLAAVPCLAAMTLASRTREWLQSEPSPNKPVEPTPKDGAAHRPRWAT